MLMVVFDPTASITRRSAASFGAAKAMEELQEKSRPATHYFNKLYSVQHVADQLETSLKAATQRIKDSLRVIYRDPERALVELGKLQTKFGGPGRTAAEIREMPTWLCPDGGILSDGIRGGIFKSDERKAALDAVPELAAAIEARGRVRERLVSQRGTLSVLMAEPSKDSKLAESIAAHEALAAIRGAVGGSDPLTAAMLAEQANVLALRAPLDDIVTAPDVGVTYRSMMTDQIARRQNIEKLIEGRQSGNALDNFRDAQEQVILNGQSAVRLARDGFLEPARKAEEWSAIADGEAYHAATRIMSDHVQHAMATQANMLHTIDAYLSTHGNLDNQRNSSAPHLPSA